jgi:hypothetical protein
LRKEQETNDRGLINHRAWSVGDPQPKPNCIKCRSGATLRHCSRRNRIRLFGRDLSRGQCVLPAHKPAAGIRRNYRASQLGDDERRDIVWTNARERIGECPCNCHGRIGKGRRRREPIGRRNVQADRCCYRCVVGLERQQYRAVGVKGKGRDQYREAKLATAEPDQAAKNSYGHSEAGCCERPTDRIETLTGDHSASPWGQAQQPDGQQVASAVFSTFLSGFTARMKALMNFPST